MSCATHSVFRIFSVWSVVVAFFRRLKEILAYRSFVSAQNPPSPWQIGGIAAIGTAGREPNGVIIGGTAVGTNAQANGCPGAEHLSDSKPQLRHRGPRGSTPKEIGAFPPTPNATDATKVPRPRPRPRQPKPDPDPPTPIQTQIQRPQIPPP